MDINRTDSQILTLLQNDGRLSNVELAELISLSPSPCLRRVKQMENKGFIQGYRATLDRVKIGFSMTVFIEVSLTNHSGNASSAFETSVLAMPNVISAYLTSGSADYRL